MTMQYVKSHFKFPNRAVVAVLLDVSKKGVVKWVGTNSSTVTDDKQLFFGPGDGHIHASVIFQEPDITFVIAAHKG